jgi:anti-sigma B factor antagonist
MSSGSRPRIRTEHVDDVLVLSFIDSKIVTEDQIQEVTDQLFEIADAAAKKKLLLNFGNVQYCSSALLGKLVGFKRRAEAVRAKLKLCCIHSDLMAPFKLTGLDKLFEIYPEEQTAIDKF